MYYFGALIVFMGIGVIIYLAYQNSKQELTA